MPAFRDIPGSARLPWQLLIGHLRHRRRPLSLAQRWAALPLSGAPTSLPVTVHWNTQMVPFIEAENERDLAVGLGMVHGHLRLAQIEFLRRVSQGRLSEWLGPLACDLDHSLRTIDLPRATPAMLDALPAATRAWLQGFAGGLNHIVDHVLKDRRRWPEEMRILDVAPAPWSVSDLLTLSRLNCADFTWSVWPRLLPLRHGENWPHIWQTLMQHSGGPPIPDTETPPLSANGLAMLGASFGKPGGSNAVAIHARLGAGGTAKLSGDPHLPVVLPGFWLLAGLHCPSLQSVGYMLPGLPAVMVGRNASIAWGGTSLHAASSDLFDVSDEPDSAFHQRSETLRPRWAKPRKVDITESKWGPVITDTPALGKMMGAGEGKSGRLTMRWMGHESSDEISALLSVARSQNFTEFQQSLDGFAVAGQNMVYADVDGNIGQVMAARLPARPPQRPDDMVLPAGAIRDWEHTLNIKDLPRHYNPPEGFVASANNRPSPDSDILVSCFFSPFDRVNRLRQRLAEVDSVDTTLLRELQRDVHSASALPLRDRLLTLMDDKGGHIQQILTAWNGDYDTDSDGALVFEFLLYHFAMGLYGKEGLPILTANWDPRGLLNADLHTRSESDLQCAMQRALPALTKALKKYRYWGQVHRLRINHPLSALPVLGRRWRFGEQAVAGANETLMKSAHGLSGKRHHVGMSSTARYLFDLGDIDDNWFVMLGGQDGEPGSAAFLDQLPLWENNQAIQIPMDLELVRSKFNAHTSVIAPGAAAPDD